MLYDRYYYSILNKKEQTVYKQIYNALENLQPEILIKKSLLCNLPFDRIFYFVGFDNPHLFFVDFLRFEAEDNFGFIVLKVNYFYTRSEIERIKIKINNVVNKIISKISGATDYEKELALHDLFVKDVMYDKYALIDIKNSYVCSNTILGVLFYKMAICEGVAKTVKFILNIMNIKCIVVYGKNSQQNVKHAWNMVKLGGESYHLDLTWDIAVSFGGAISHDYFNVTTRDILMDHDFLYDYPQCTDNNLNYYRLNNLYCYKKTDVKHVVDFATKTNKDYVCFKYLGNDTCISNVLKFAASISSSKLVGCRNVGSFNSSQNTCIVVFNVKMQKNEEQLGLQKRQMLKTYELPRNKEPKSFIITLFNKIKKFFSN